MIVLVLREVMAMPYMYSCPAGTVSTEGNSPSCAACPAGSLPRQTRSVASFVRGTWSTANSCEACAAGTYAFGSGSPSCLMSFRFAQRGRQDVLCGMSAGNNAPEGSTSCLTCEPGTYAPHSRDVCPDRPSGLSIRGGASYVACAADTQAFAGSPQCYTASEMFTTLGAGVSKRHH